MSMTTVVDMVRMVGMAMMVAMVTMVAMAMMVDMDTDINIFAGAPVHEFRIQLGVAMRPRCFCIDRR